MKQSPQLHLVPLAAASLWLLLLAGGCTAVSEEDGEYTPPPRPSSTIGRMRPDAQLQPFRE